MKDALNRRSRFAKPQPEDFRIEITERDFAIFDAIHRHGALPSNYIYELTKQYGKDLTFLKKRLTQLYNGYCPHPDHRSQNKDGHVCRPITFLKRNWAQFDTFHARYQHLVYDLTENSKSLLKNPLPSRRSSSFAHDLFASCIAVSAEVGAPPHEFIHRNDILEKAGRKTVAIPLSEGNLVPDDLFGLKYSDGKYRFFALEADMSTQPVASKNLERSSIAKKLKEYQSVLTDKLHTQHLTIPNITVLFATTNDAHKQTMIEFVRETVHPTYQKKFLFKSFANFETPWRVPPQLLPVYEKWHSVEGEVEIAK